MASNFCSNCGAPNPGGGNFCSKCGTPFSALTGEKTQSVPPVQPQPAISPAQPYNAPPGKAAAPPRKKGMKLWKILTIIVVAIIVVAGIIAAVTMLSRGEADKGYYQIGGDRIPSVAYALGKELKIQSSVAGMINDVGTLSVVYNVAGSEQGADMRAYFDYLQRKDGFSMRSDSGGAFNQTTGSGIQAWRNSEQQGYMIVVQVDYDKNGYTVTLMRGEGQLEGTGTSASANTQAPASGPSAAGGETESLDEAILQLLPPGEPDSSITFNDLMVSFYDDGTVAINEGGVILKPNGKIYIDAEECQADGTISVPEGGSSSTVNNCTVTAVNGEMYVAAYGNVIVITTDDIVYLCTEG